MAAGDGDLAAGTARRPNSGVVPPHPDEHDLLAGLAHQGRSLRQWRLLAPDVPARPQPVDADAVTTCPSSPTLLPSERGEGSCSPSPVEPGEGVGGEGLALRANSCALPMSLDESVSSSPLYW